MCVKKLTIPSWVLIGKNQRQLLRQRSTSVLGGITSCLSLKLSKIQAFTWSSRTHFYGSETTWRIGLYFSTKFHSTCVFKLYHPFCFSPKRIISHMSKEFVCYVLGGISSVPAGPIVARMMLKQMETVLTAVDVTSMYKGLLPCSWGSWLQAWDVAWGEMRGGSLSICVCRQREVCFLERWMGSVAARSPSLSHSLVLIPGSAGTICFYWLLNGLTHIRPFPLLKPFWCWSPRDLQGFSQREKEEQERKSYPLSRICTKQKAGPSVEKQTTWNHRMLRGWKGP